MPKVMPNKPRLRRLTAAIALTSLVLTGCAAQTSGGSSNATGGRTLSTASPAPRADTTRTTGPDGSTLAPGNTGTPADPASPVDNGAPGSGDADSAGGSPATGAGATGQASPAASAPQPAANLVQWPDNSKVSHIFVHSLAVDAKVAFNAPNDGPGYLDFMVSVDEFKKVIEQMYAKGYVLVSPHQLATVAPDGTMTPKPLMLPEGKQPFVLSVDDVNYYEYMENDGFATKLVIDNGKVVNEYKDPKTGKVTRGAYDVVPILDDFIDKHPDFSHEGAKGILAVTGYNGVLGYRTSAYYYKDSNPNFAADTAEAKRVADALKADGWEFASHSWGHISCTSNSVSRIQVDNQRWMDEVKPIVGPTDLLIYPFGADISGVDKYTRDNPKFAYLKDQGFNFFFNVDGSTPAWGQLTPDALRQARINIDGISLKAAMNGRPVLSAFFDPKSVIDPARPPSISGTR
ncbi:polysaccharide deacetylase [Micrococcales bacterium 31B]|nr:polysaccharide deacetylase [Micrococcales bacterium 31B]